MSGPKYPDVTVRLSGESGNPFHIVSRVSGALRKAEVSDAEVKAFQKEAMSLDYDHVLQTCMGWVDVE